MKRDYALTFAAELLVLGLGLIVFRVAATYWPPQLFSEYVLARRVLALIQGSVALGLAISLPRYIAHAHATGRDPDASGRYLATGITLVLCVLLVVGACFLLMPSLLASLLFGDARLRVMWAPIFLCLAGLLGHTLAYGYFRGRLNMPAANALQVINQGAAHLLPFLVARGLTAPDVFAVVGTIWVTTTGTTLFSLIVRRHGLAMFAPSSLRAHGRELLRYGAPRIPGDITLTALFNLPATLAAHVGTLVQAGYLAFSLSALSLMGGVFAPIGLVLLPDATRMVARGQTERLRRGLKLLLLVGIGLTLAGVGLVEVIATPLVAWYLGPAYAPAAAVLRLVLLGAVPYVVYVLLRSALDALSIKAINTRNLAIALVCFAVTAGALRSVGGIAIAVSAAMLVAGLLSGWDTWRLLRVAPGDTKAPGR